MGSNSGHALATTANHPRTRDDVRSWFNSALRLAGRIALSDSPVFEEVRKSIAGQFRGLWVTIGQAEELDRIARANRQEFVLARWLDCSARDAVL